MIQNHLQNSANHKMVKKIRKYWIRSKKMTDTGNKHKCNNIIRSNKYISRVFDIHDAFREIYLYYKEMKQKYKKYYLFVVLWLKQEQMTMNQKIEIQAQN